MVLLQCLRDEIRIYYGTAKVLHIGMRSGGTKQRFIRSNLAIDISPHIIKPAFFTLIEITDYAKIMTFVRKFNISVFRFRILSSQKVEFLSFNTT